MRKPAQGYFFIKWRNTQDW